MQRVYWLILLSFVVVAVPTRGQGLFGPPAAEEEEDLFGVPAEKKAPQPELTLADREFQKQVLERMQKPVEWDVEEETLLDFADRLSAALDITVHVDWRSLDDLGLAEEDTVKVQFGKMPLEQALEYVLYQHDLCWSFERRVLVILSEDEQLGRLDTQVYDVRDLIYPTNDVHGPNFDTLIDVIVSTIEPDTWVENGGGGADIRPLHVPGIDALVISQSQRTHRKIERLLTEMRTVRGTDALLLAPTIAWGELESRLGPLASSLEETAAPPGAEEELKLPELGSENFAGAVTRANEFSFDLYRRVAKRGEGNQLLSGYGAREVLTIALCGAKGQTRRELERVLRFPAGERGHGLESFALRSTLARSGGGVNLAVASGLWIDQRHALRPEFVTAADQLLNVATRSVDFREPEAAALLMNRWGAAATKGRIPEFIDAQRVAECDPWVLASAVYLKGSWQVPFARESTSDQDFRLASGERVKVPTLHGRVDARAGELESGAIIGQLYYRDRGASMIVVVPPDGPGAFSELEQSVSAAQLDEWLQPLRLGDRDVAMPKFRFESRHELMPVLREMGLQGATDSGTADFSNIAQGLALQQVWQRSVIEVDEEGTTAAAISGGGAFGGPLPTNLDELVIDRPFLFFIRDGQTGCVLFQGRVMDPRN